MNMLLLKGYVQPFHLTHTHYDKAARRKGIYKCSKNLIYEKLKMAMLDFLETEEGAKLLETRGDAISSYWRYQTQYGIQETAITTHTQSHRGDWLGSHCP